jgi:hypothetical protein
VRCAEIEKYIQSVARLLGVYGNHVIHETIAERVDYFLLGGRQLAGLGDRIEKSLKE